MNHLEMQEDEAKVLQAKKRAGNATGSLLPTRSVKVFQARRKILPGIDRRSNTLIFA
jgi:hypothetical protein